MALIKISYVHDGISVSLVMTPTVSTLNIMKRWHITNCMEPMAYVTIQFCILYKIVICGLNNPKLVLESWFQCNSLDKIVSYCPNLVTNWKRLKSSDAAVTINQAKPTHHTFKLSLRPHIEKYCIQIFLFFITLSLLYKFLSTSLYEQVCACIFFKIDSLP